MSLVSLAVRTCVVRLLRGRTWAGLVQDSPIDPLADVIEGWGKTGGAKLTPVLAVYVDEAQSEPQGRERSGPSQKLDVVIFIYLPPGPFVAAHGAGMVEFETRRSGGGAAMDLLVWQVQTALRDQANGPWIDIFQGFVHRFSNIQYRYVLVELEGGVRVPSAELRIKAEAAPEPISPSAPYGTWQAFLAACAGDSALVSVGSLVQAAMAGPAGLPSWKQVQHDLGLSDAAIRAIGLAPQDAAETGSPATLVETEVSGDIEINTFGGGGP